jgi:hypothetical protein
MALALNSALQFKGYAEELKSEKSSCLSTGLDFILRL